MLRDIWSVVVVLSLVGWITSALTFIFKVFPERDRFEVALAKRWGAGFAVCFLLWIVALLNA